MNLNYNDETSQFITKRLQIIDEQKIEETLILQKTGRIPEELREKNLKSNAKFMKNILILTISQIIIKLLGLIYRIVIVNFDGFGDAGNGYYASGYEIFAVMLTLSSIGIPSVISKLVSERVAIGDNKGANRIFKESLKFFTFIGILCSLLLFFGADYIATNILGVPNVNLTLKVLSPAIAFVSASAVIRGYFSGFEDMKLTSISQTLEQFLNAILSISFVYIAMVKISPQPHILAAAGNLSSTVAVILAFVYTIMYFQSKKVKVDKKQKSELDKKSSVNIIKMVLALSIPITAGSLISVLNTFIDTITISHGMQKMYQFKNINPEQLQIMIMSGKGILSKVITILGIFLAFSTAISTALIPSIAAFIAKGQKKVAKKRIENAIDITIIALLPMVVGTMVLAQPILKIVYPNASEGTYILQILAVSTIFICLSHTINGGLQGFNDVISPFIAVVVGAISKVVCNILFVPVFGIEGAAYSSIICQVLAFLVSYIAINKKIHISVGINKLFKQILSSIIMGVCVHYIYTLLLTKITNIYVLTLLSVIVGVIVYLIAIIILKVVNKEIIQMLPYGNRLVEKIETIQRRKQRKRERLKRN